jgi:hypothetical protein
LAEAINKEYFVIKETEKRKYLPKQIVELMKKEGYPKFSIHYHTLLWKSLDAKKLGNGYGTLVADKEWHWYESWVKEVRKHCLENSDQYR